MRSVMVWAMSLTLVSCVVGPKTEKKSALNVLNGENYKTTAAGGIDSVAIPIIRTNERHTKISGKVFVRDSFALIPLRMQKLELKAKGKVAATAISDEKGDFLFSDVIKNGEYEIVLESQKYEGKTSISVSGYDNRDYEIEAKTK